MSTYFKCLLAFLCLCSALLASDLPGSIEVNLQDPIYQNGMLKTDQGGVVTATGIRIQAQNIEYTNKTENNTKVVSLVAEGNLLFEYQDKIFTGSKLQYDFVSNTGTLWNGRTSQGMWFLGGDRVDLEGDGKYVIYNAFVTSCESNEPFWDVRSKKVSIQENAQLKASQVRFTFFDAPLMWLPSFKSNLETVTSPPVRYRVIWDKGIGPRVTMRYRVFSWKELSLFFRLDYRITKGPGAAIESEYFSDSGRTTFITRSYGAYDKIVPDEHGWKRYRLQGLFDHQSEDEKTTVHATYDKYHDLKMLSDFPSSDFVINTQQRTQFAIRHQEDIAYASLRVEPRLNPFESINQKLPEGKASMRPIQLGPTGIISENSVAAGYLDYVFAHQLISTYPSLRETHAGRLETNNRLYRPFSLGPIHLTPAMGVIGIFYTNSPMNKSVGQGVFTYGGDVKAPFYRHYSSFKHTIEPYLYYQGISHPKATLDRHYTFTLEDGLYQINSLKMGLLNLFRFPNGATLTLDAHTFAYFSDATYTKLCPKSYLFVTWSSPISLLEAHTSWNSQENLLDYANLRASVTVSARTAFSVEYRHRSRFHWRKADHENFILDMAHSISELENSPLSDQRSTFLSELQINISPTWSLHASSHQGWDRLTEPPYSAFKIDIYTLLASHWKLKSTYMHTTNDDRVSVQLQLVP